MIKSNEKAFVLELSLNDWLQYYITAYDIQNYPCIN